MVIRVKFKKMILLIILNNLLHKGLLKYISLFILWFVKIDDKGRACFLRLTNCNQTIRHALDVRCIPHLFGFHSTKDTAFHFF